MGADDEKDSVPIFQSFSRFHPSPMPIWSIELKKKREKERQSHHFPFFIWNFCSCFIYRIISLLFIFLLVKQIYMLNSIYQLLRCNFVQSQCIFNQNFNQFIDNCSTTKQKKSFIIVRDRICWCLMRSRIHMTNCKKHILLYYWAWHTKQFK